MPYDISKPPARIKTMPKTAQKIFISAFNSALETYKSESTAFKVAFAAVKKKFRQVNGGWKAIACKFVNQDYKFIRPKTLKRIGEDEHFVQFKTVLTKVGVMNGAYKSPEEVEKMLKLIPKQYMATGIPIINDHFDDDPFDPEVEVPDDSFLSGFVTDLHYEGKGRNLKLVGVDNVPKSEPETVAGIESGDYRGSSIGYMRDLIPEEGEWSNEKGEGVRYQFIEKNMRIHHHARMLTQNPACEPPYCGIQKKTPEGFQEGVFVPDSLKIHNGESILSQDEVNGMINMTDKENENPDKKVVKTITQEIGINDMSPEKIAESNPAVKAKFDESVATKEELEKLKKEMEALKEKATKFDEFEKKAREDAEKELKELYKDKFSAEDITGMAINEIKRLTEVGKKFQKTTNESSTAIDLNDKNVNRADVEDAMAKSVDVYNKEKKCWERPGYDA